MFSVFPPSKLYLFCLLPPFYLPLKIEVDGNVVRDLFWLPFSSQTIVSLQLVLADLFAP